MSVVQCPFAAGDIEKAYQWYGRQRSGLGLSFLLRVDEAIAVIERHPRLPVRLIGEGRPVTLKQFPYQLWYVIRPDGEFVVSCLHGKRNHYLRRAAWKAHPDRLAQDMKTTNQSQDNLPQLLIELEDFRSNQ